ncbi:hypothetical protein ABH922_003047 [Rhodococcus sp. 27YEA15]|uniref:hypothetical protein n=1 Tax=Rhodococcus sp. 27YEA15 TaxID=3156259 RepID=UPI003C7D4451
MTHAQIAPVVAPYSLTRHKFSPLFAALPIAVLGDVKAEPTPIHDALSTALDVDWPTEGDTDQSDLDAITIENGVIRFADETSATPAAGRGVIVSAVLSALIVLVLAGIYAIAPIGGAA